VIRFSIGSGNKEKKGWKEHKKYEGI